MFNSCISTQPQRHDLAWSPSVVRTLLNALFHVYGCVLACAYKCVPRQWSVCLCVWGVLTQPESLRALNCQLLSGFPGTEALLFKCNRCQDISQYKEALCVCVCACLWAGHPGSMRLNHQWGFMCSKGAFSWFTDKAVRVDGVAQQAMCICFSSFDASWEFIWQVFCAKCTISKTLYHAQSFWNKMTEDAIFL